MSRTLSIKGLVGACILAFMLLAYTHVTHAQTTDPKLVELENTIKQLQVVVNSLVTGTQKLASHTGPVASVTSSLTNILPNVATTITGTAMNTNLIKFTITYPSGATAVTNLAVTNGTWSYSKPTGFPAGLYSIKIEDAGGTNLVLANRKFATADTVVAYKRATPVHYVTVATRAEAKTACQSYRNTLPTTDVDRNEVWCTWNRFIVDGAGPVALTPGEMVASKYDQSTMDFRVPFYARGKYNIVQCPSGGCTKATRGPSESFGNYVIEDLAGNIVKTGLLTGPNLAGEPILVPYGSGYQAIPNYPGADYSLIGQFRPDVNGDYRVRLTDLNFKFDDRMLRMDLVPKRSFTTGLVSLSTPSGLVIDPPVTSEVVVNTRDGSLNDYAQYTVEFDVTAIDQDVYIPTSGTSINYSLLNGAGTAAPVGTRSITLTSSAIADGAYYVVDEGDTKTFTLTVVYTPGIANTAARLQINAINYAATPITPNQTWQALPAVEYRTAVVTIVN